MPPLPGVTHAVRTFGSAATAPALVSIHAAPSATADATQERRIKLFMKRILSSVDDDDEGPDLIEGPSGGRMRVYGNQILSRRERRRREVEARGDEPIAEDRGDVGTRRVGRRGAEEDRRSGGGPRPRVNRVDAGARRRARVDRPAGDQERAAHVLAVARRVDRHRERQRAYGDGDASRGVERPRHRIVRDRGDDVAAWREVLPSGEREP